MIRKDTTFYEKQRQIGAGYSAPQGLGYKFPDAKAAKSASQSVEFSITQKSLYGTFSLEGLLMRRAESDKAIIVDPLKRESKNLIYTWMRELSRTIHGNGGGSLGRIAAVTGAEVTLTSFGDTRAFEKNIALEASATDGTSGTVKAGFVTIDRVQRDRKVPKLIATANWAAGIPTVAANDFLFRRGGFGQAISGFDAWNPLWSTTQLPGAFKGADRNLDPERLAGICLDARTLSPRLAALRAARLVHEAGGKPDTYILSTEDYENLANELQSAGLLRYSAVPATGIGKYQFGIKYDAIQIMGPAGPIDCLADPDAPVGIGRMLQRDTWVLASMGELVHWINGANPNGMGMLENDQDEVEFRMVGDLDMYCEAPGWNCRVQLA
ncbi:MAG: hypothetical protein C4308_14635 [Chitinophagaceae bacterium]